MTTYPDVPDSPGVPPVPRDPNAGPQLRTETATVDASSLSQAAQEAVWGIYDKAGALAIYADSFAEIEYSREFKVATYPMEEGAFQSYNKVETPFDVGVVLTRGGSDADRTEFVNTIDALLASLDLYDVVTPERTYLNVNIVRGRYRRRAESGATLITAEIQCEQIRETATVAFSNVKSLSATGQTDTGAVQGQTPTPAQSTAAAGAQ